MSLYSSYQPLLSEDTDTGEVPWDSGIAAGRSDTFVWHTYWFFPDHRFLFNFFLSPPTLAQLQALWCPRRHLFLCFCRGVQDFQVHGVQAAVGWRWSALLESWRPDDVAVLHTLSAWVESLLSLHGLQGKELVVLHSMWARCNTHQFAAGSEPSKRSHPCKDAW